MSTLCTKQCRMYIQGSLYMSVLQHWCHSNHSIRVEPRVLLSLSINRGPHSRWRNLHTNFGESRKKQLRNRRRRRKKKTKNVNATRRKTGKHGAVPHPPPGHATAMARMMPAAPVPFQQLFFFISCDVLCAISETPQARLSALGRRGRTPTVPTRTQPSSFPQQHFFSVN